MSSILKVIYFWESLYSKHERSLDSFPSMSCFSWFSVNTVDTFPSSFGSTQFFANKKTVC